MRVKKQVFLILPALLLVLLLFSALYVASPAYTGARFADEAKDHVGIYLEDETIYTSDPEAVLVEGTTATITKGGSYKLSGALSDGQIIIAAPVEDEVVLKLDDVDLHCEHSAPIWAKSAGKLKLSLPEDTINRLSDGPVYSDPDPAVKCPSACVYAQCDLTIKGTGQLTVDAAFRNGVQSTDDLHLNGGVLLVTAPHYALRGKDEVTVTAGIHQLTCDDTAVSTVGYVDVQAGELTIDTGGSAFHAFQSVRVGAGSRVKARCGLMSVQCSGPIELAYPITEGEEE